MKKILISGFDAFGEDTINPSLEIIKQLPMQIGNFTIYPMDLPTQAKVSVELLKAKIKEIEPDVVINIGLAKGRERITLERVAINVDDFRIPDNAGEQPIDEPIEENGPDGYFTNLPIKMLSQALKEAGHRVSISNSAGTFVCNHVMFAMQHLVHTQYPTMKTGFIHVPTIEEKGQVGMPLAKMVDAIICVIFNLDHGEIKTGEGALW